MKTIILLFLTILLLASCTLKKIEKENTETSTVDNVTNVNPPADFEESKTQTADSVPLPTGEDIIRTFFALINEKRIPEAIDMMSEKAVPDEATKQAWGVQFNAFNSVVISDIEKFSESEWTNSWQEYQVTLETEMSPESANEPIPYFGYDSKTNIRWVTIEKNSENLWKVVGISTGP